MTTRKIEEEFEDHKTTAASLVTKEELASLGDGEVAYIREMTSSEAMAAFPNLDDLPAGINLFALHGADGQPIALTDDRGVAIEHAISDDLEIATVH